MRKLFFLMFVVFLASCGEDVVNDPPVDVLFLKSASVDEERVVYSNGTEIYQFPNDVLIRVSALGDHAEVVNNPTLEIEDFKVLSDQALLTVSNGGLVSTITAKKLPFVPKDYAPQTETGDAKYNGIIKSKNFVFSVNGKNIKILDLRTDFLTTTIASISNDSYVFKVGVDILKLRLTKILSENGNIFQLLVLYNEAENDIGYTLLTK